jgi:hypothetical protein
LDAALGSGGNFAEIFCEAWRDNGLQRLRRAGEAENSSRLHGADIRVFFPA